MTQAEYKTCEKLMEEAIQKVKAANKEYDESEIGIRKADQHYGEAIGMHQVLVSLGFKHDRMKELEDLL
jgi:Holliday junction resolvasome RuvABC DNA-binding subunit